MKGQPGMILFHTHLGNLYNMIQCYILELFKCKTIAVTKTNVKKNATYKKT